MRVGNHGKPIQVMSIARWILVFHLLGAMMLVGGQLFSTWLAFAASRDRTALAAWSRFDGRFRAIAVITLLVTAGLGFLVARGTVVSNALLVTTPYGPLLAAKLSMSLLWLILLVFAPSAARSASEPHRPTGLVWSIARSGVAVAVVILTGFLQSV